MLVRTAERSDLVGIGTVAEGAHWASYAGLLHPETIGRLLQRDYSPASLAARLLRGGVVVVTADEEVVGFADGIVTDEAVYLDAIATAPGHRRRGIGSALLGAVCATCDTLPMAVTVLLGHFEGEQFLEANGFVPGEVSQERLFGEDIVERRWWLAAMRDDVAPSRAAAGGA